MTPGTIIAADFDMSGREQERLAKRIDADIAPLVEALRHAIGIIEAHVARDALGMGGDRRDGQWPLLDEYLHHMKAAIAKAKQEEQT